MWSRCAPSHGVPVWGVCLALLCKELSQERKWDCWCMVRCVLTSIRNWEDLPNTAHTGGWWDGSRGGLRMLQCVPRIMNVAYIYLCLLLLDIGTMYSTSQELCMWFMLDFVLLLDISLSYPRNMHVVHVLLHVGVVSIDRFYLYPPGLLHWHWGNHMIAPVPVEQPWRIWVNQSYDCTTNWWYNHNKTKHNKTMFIFMGYIAQTSTTWCVIAVRVQTHQLHTNKWVINLSGTCFDDWQDLYVV